MFQTTLSIISPQHLKTLREPPKNFHFLAFQDKDIPRLARSGVLEKCSPSSGIHPTGCELSVSVIIGFTRNVPSLSPPTSAFLLCFFLCLCFIFCSPTKSCAAYGDSYLCRECPIHPTHVQDKGYKILTMSFDLYHKPVRWCSSYCENEENEIFLREVRTIHPTWYTAEQAQGARF